MSLSIILFYGIYRTLPVRTMTYTVIFIKFGIHNQRQHEQSINNQHISIINHLLFLR
jgi:hypothetical protein